MLPPGRSKPLGHCARGPVGMAMRSSATVPQPLPAICLKAPDTLVAGLATNAKLAAQIHEAYSPCLPSLDEAYLLGFEVRLFPGQHIPPHEMTPIISQCLTHVPGLYPRRASPGSCFGSLFWNLSCRVVAAASHWTAGLSLQVCGRAACAEGMGEPLLPQESPGQASLVFGEPFGAPVKTGPVVMIGHL